MAERFDAIVIGAGQAGPALAVRCGKEGLRTALVERHRFGGTCVNNGCVPTKTLIASARAAHVARRAADYGIAIDAPIRIDMARVKARKDAVVRHSREGVRRWLDGARNVSVIEGHAAFSGPHQIRVGERPLEAPRIFINVGGRAAVPQMPGIESVPYLNNERIMHLERVPEHLIVVGGSYIGLEFAQMYRRFGARVTIVEMGPRLIAREDEDVSAGIHEILTGEGVDIRLGATCVALQHSGGQVAVSVACGDGPPALEGSHVLLATGRVPNTHDLGLEAAGVRTDARGYIAVDDSLATSVQGVYALGDCNGHGAFTHTSWNDYEIVAANLFDGGRRRLSDRVTAYALFIDPPLGRIGLTDAQLRASGRKALVARMPMTRVGRAREMGETAGFMKIGVDADTREILGAAILGVHGDEVIQAILEVMYARRPYTVITNGMHIHPTVAELVPTLLEGLKPLD
ncbi:MAG: mercuric reductase [Betaproteobacteria bacterium RIFCSPLOWO2_02_67_12]|nr:MAG: mercuric reductase [Betaproteobacteria bacterium RIFCSPLOWO2_02_67_12]OGA29340.1 MAG: mercuric reductase [Betaproteobacteria bacterium RIFCSPLOWO2_02_FULL_68_150]OGA64106.1 MAG: mercuric reductase [Betaproteobacteria bacterium RIFCSPLOWO2_12_FULL_67_28]